MSGRARALSGAPAAAGAGPLDLIHRSNSPNPHGCWRLGRWDPESGGWVEGGAAAGCDLCETGCDGRPDCRLRAMGQPVPKYSALTPDGRRVLLEVGQFFDKDGTLRRRGEDDAKSTP